MNKFCPKCKTIREEKEFYKNKKTNKLHVYCILCKLNEQKIRRKKDFVRMREIERLSYLKNKDSKNKRVKEYRFKNREICREQNRKYNKLRYLTDIDYQIKKRLRRGLLLATKRKGNRKYYHTMSLLGCNISLFKEHLINNFYKKYNVILNWDDFLKNGNIYHLDHIIPCEAFDLSYPEAQKLCFNYKNIQVLLKNDNERKNDFLLNGKRAKNLEVKIKDLQDLEKLMMV
jgi:hypothetical protein